MFCFQKQSIPITVAALLSSQIITAIKFLHQCQIIHGDLKPDNVIVKSMLVSSLYSWPIERI